LEDLFSLIFYPSTHISTCEKPLHKAMLYNTHLFADVLEVLQ